jgi:outer membrane protein assembly factor BamB
VTGRRSRRRPRSLALAGALALLAAVATSCDAGTPQDWPTFGQDAGHNGLSTETSISTANASDLGIKWQVDTGDAVYASPVVAFNAQLKKRLVYIANNSGVMSAYDAANGNRVWFRQAGPRINSTATVVDGTVYVGSADKKLYALNAATGAIQCTFFTGGVIASSPVAVNPDGTGVVVYFGDNGLSGTDDGGHVWAMNGVDPNAATNCSKKWVFNAYGSPPGSQPNAGTWSPPAFGKDKNGRPLVFFGGSSPDDAVYAVDARAGTKVWRFQANPDHKFDADVGAGPTVSAPGRNGFADGVVYVSGKENAVYALNLRTGAKVWRFDIVADSPGVEGYARSTAALVHDLLFVGYGSGLYQLSALDGAKDWKTAPTAEVISSPAVVGSDSSRIAIAGDLTGVVRAWDAGTGSQRWSYQTSGQVYSSPAVSAGTIFIGSTDGFLYAFTPGGASSGAPTTQITSPVDGSTVDNPGGSLAVEGSAQDNGAVKQVLYAVHDENARRWWNATTGTWGTVFAQNKATLTAPGATNTGWSGSFPVKPDGGSFTTLAEAVDIGGQHDPTPASSTVFAEATGDSPNTSISAPGEGQVLHFPGGTRQEFTTTIRGSASDPGGSKRGVTKVMVVVQNLEHGEYFCKLPTCNPFGDFPWTSAYNAQPATLASPGAATTTWSLPVLLYDHPHSYMVTAWAVDGNGHTEQSRPTRTFCVRDAGITTCS